jgi:hypothetical protein
MPGAERVRALMRISVAWEKVAAAEERRFEPMGTD